MVKLEVVRLTCDEIGCRIEQWKAVRSRSENPAGSRTESGRGREDSLTHRVINQKLGENVRSTNRRLTEPGIFITTTTTTTV